MKIKSNAFVLSSIIYLTAGLMLDNDHYPVTIRSAIPLFLIILASMVSARGSEQKDD